MPHSVVEQIEIPDLGDLNLQNALDAPAGTHHDELARSHEFEPAAPLRPDDEEKPIAEYALHILFTRFVRYTEKKLSMISQVSDDAIEQLLGEGVDAEFDLILESLGHVARRRPKPVIDSIMYWRKTKRNNPIMSLASLYVLCRALMEVIRQTPHEILGESLGEKLEDIVFKQIMQADLEVVASKGVRGANWRYLAKLLGEMSGSRLASVDDRFLAELEKKITSKSQEALAALLLDAMQYLKIKLYPEEFLEESSLFLESLSKFYLRTPTSSGLRTKYATAISQMLEPLAESVTVEVNQPVWARTMEVLYHTSQAKGTSSGLASRAVSAASSFQSATSPAFALSVMSLCLSPQAFFSDRWLTLLESYIQKAKTKPQRVVQLMPSAARLTWVYMFRCSESLNATTKKIEALRKLFLTNTSRKYWQAVNADKEARAAYISLLRSAFQGYQQYTLDELLFPMLVGGDSTTVSQQQSIAFDSAVLPERAGVAVDAFTAVMKDLRSGNRPPFPAVKMSAALSSPPPTSEGLSGAREAKDSELPHRPVITAAMQASIDLFGSCIGQIGTWIEQGSTISDQTSRQNSVSHLVSLASGNASSSSQISDVTAERNELGVKSAEQHLLLMFLRSWPTWWSPEHLRHLDVLCRCVGHPIKSIHEAAAESLRKIAQESDLRMVFAAYTKAMMSADAKNAEALDVIGIQGLSSPSNTTEASGSHGHSSSFSFGGSLRSNSFGLGLHMGSNSNDYDASPPQGDAQNPHNAVAKHLALYVELIELWISRLQNGDAAVPGPSVDSQLLVLWSAVEEIEGNGLFFLCSQEMTIRSLGLRILWLTTAMDQAIMDYQESTQPTSEDSKPSRIINLLQTTPIVQIISQSWKRLELSMPERNRLAKFRSKRASLARLAESSYGVDSALWLKFFPTVITLCFETHPIPVALCRNLVSDRLVQMHEAISDITTRPELSMNLPAVYSLVEQWKVYLIVACATLTSTEDQKLHVPTQSNPLSGLSAMHTRKRSHQRITLHHQRITSARSVFRIVIPMLGSDKNSVRDAIVAGLSCTNLNTYKTLLECLQPVLSDALPKFEQLQKQQLKASSVSGDSLLRVITGIGQILKQTTIFLENKDIRQDVWIRTEVVSVLQQLREMLGHINSTQGTPLRIAFSELLTDTYSALGPSLMFTGRNPAAEWLLFWKTVDMWSPYGSNSAAVLENRANIRRSAHSDVVLAQFEILKRDTDRATSRAMAALLKDSQGLMDDLQLVMHWVYTLLASNADQTAQDIGRTALENLLISHASRPELLLEIVTRCYHNSSEHSRGIAKVYFVALVNILEAHPELLKQKMEKPQQFLALALFKIGVPDRQTRFRAVKLIEIVEEALYGESVIAGEFQFRLRSSSPSVYKREIFVLSGKLAAKRSHESFYLFSQMTRAFQAVNDSDRRDILSVVLPWIQNIEFSEENETALQMVLANLLEITAVFSGRMQHEVEALWVALCTSSTGAANALKVLDFLLDFCLQQRTAGTVAVSRTALIYLLASPASGVITEKLLSYLEPAHMITQSNDTAELVSPSCAEEFPYVASLANVVALANETEQGTKNTGSLPPFSHGQLAVVFLVDTISASTPVAPKLASLLHVCVALGDHFVSLVQDKTRELLLNLAGMLNPEPESMQKLTTLLGNLRWSYGDESGAVPDQMGELVSALLAHLKGQDALDPNEWSQVALRWATASPVRHIACRSLQVYRCLDLYLDAKILGDLLARLSSTISEQSSEIQGFATQALMTLNSIVDQLEPEKLVAYPQLFWATVASLSTVNEREYIESLSILSKILKKWSPPVAEAILQAFPPRWDAPLDHFTGVLPLVLQGLRSQESVDMSYEVLDQLIELRKEQLSDGEILLLYGAQRDPSPYLLAACLPRFLNAMDQPHLVSGLIPTAQILHQIVSPYSGGLARTLDSFMKKRFWSKADFLRQYVLALPSAFPLYNVDLVILYLQMVNNSSRAVRQAALDILKTLIPEVQVNGIDAEKWRGADLVAPLLRLLTTPDVEESLSVLDLVASVKPDPLDRDVLRMTLGSRQLLREYEYTETLFGIPDDHGWSVPMPAQVSITTRQKVHAVFYTCSPNFATSADDAGFDDLEDVAHIFERDEEYTFEQNLYRHMSVPGSSHNVATESMDKILTDLDEFDSFFTRVGVPQPIQQRLSGRPTSDRNSPNTSSRNSRPASLSSPRARVFGNPRADMSSSDLQHSSPRAQMSSESESVPQLYDKKVSLILNRSLARSPSQVSFKTSFADSFGRGRAPSVSSQANGVAGSQPASNQSPEKYAAGPSTGYMNYSFADNTSIVSLSRTHTRMSADSTATVADSQDYDLSAHMSSSSFNLFSGGLHSSVASRDATHWQSSSVDEYTPGEYVSSTTGSFAGPDINDKYHPPPPAVPLGTVGEAPVFQNSAMLKQVSPSDLQAAKDGKRQPDSSFRLESLLRGKRRTKPEKPKDKTKSRFMKEAAPRDRTPEAFKFPPRQ